MDNLFNQSDIILYSIPLVSMFLMFYIMYKRSGAKNWKEYGEINKIKRDEENKRILNFMEKFLPSNMNTTQKVLLLIFLISFILWFIFGIQLSGEHASRYLQRRPKYMHEWYQIVLFATYIGSFVGIYLFKD